MGGRLREIDALLVRDLADLDELVHEAAELDERMAAGLDSLTVETVADLLHVREHLLQLFRRVDAIERVLRGHPPTTPEIYSTRENLRKDHALRWGRNFEDIARPLHPDREPDHLGR